VIAAGDIMKESELNDIRDELLRLLTNYLQSDDETKEKIRSIGTRLDLEDGMELMREVGTMVQRKDPLKASWLNNAWNRIGNWRS
jgi:hypothetical protein